MPKTTNLTRNIRIVTKRKISSGQGDAVRVAILVELFASCLDQAQTAHIALLGRDDVEIGK